MHACMCHLNHVHTCFAGMHACMCHLNHVYTCFADTASGFDDEENDHGDFNRNVCFYV